MRHLVLLLALATVPVAAQLISALAAVALAGTGQPSLPAPP